jgi:uncharacterized protein
VTGPARPAVSGIIDPSVHLRGHTAVALYKLRPAAAARARPWTAGRLAEAMDEAGVAQVGLIASVSAIGVGGPVDPISPDEVAEVVEALPGRAFGLLGINPAAGVRTLREIQYAVGELGFKGVHCYPHWWGIDIDDRRYYPIYGKCAELGVPVCLQVGAPTPRSGAKLCGRPYLIDQIAFDFPELRLAGTHIGRPWADEMLLMCNNHENVYLIADGYSPATWETAILDYLRDPLGKKIEPTRKVIWGTDWPIQTFAASLAEVAALDLPKAIVERLVRDNARDFFGL